MENCFRIYSDTKAIETVRSMIKSNRLAHAIALTGPKGCGKKTIAKYISAMLVCDNNNGTVCGKCKNCKTVAHDTHPDVITVIHSSSQKGFSVENIRNIIHDAYIAPNNSDKKIYIFADCDNMSAIAQNTLLKLIEEPPEFTYFIFTATSKASFLQTIQSRLITLGVSETTEENSLKALKELNIADDKTIKDAVYTFGGNIGMCISYINNSETKKSVDITRNIINAMINSGEYGLIKAFSEIGSDREQLSEILRLLTEAIRDATASRLEDNLLVSSCKSEAKKLSSKLSYKQADDIYYLLCDTISKVDGNSNISLTVAYLCSKIKSIII